MGKSKLRIPSASSRELSAEDKALQWAINSAGGVSSLAEQTNWSPEFVAQAVEDRGLPDFPHFAADVERLTGVKVEDLCPRVIWFRDHAGIVGFAQPINNDLNYLAAAIRNQHAQPAHAKLDPLALLIDDAGAAESDICGYGVAAYEVAPGQTVSKLLGEAQDLLGTVMGLIHHRCIAADDHEASAMARLIGMAELCLDRACNRLYVEYIDAVSH